MAFFKIQVKLINTNLTNDQIEHIVRNLNSFIWAIRKSLAINKYEVYQLEDEKSFMIFYETENKVNILRNRILEIQYNEVLGKFRRNDTWESIKIELIE